VRFGHFELHSFSCALIPGTLSGKSEDQSTVATLVNMRWLATRERYDCLLAMIHRWENWAAWWLVHRHV